jgi:hypothetical protein
MDDGGIHMRCVYMIFCTFSSCSLVAEVGIAPFTFSCTALLFAPS